MMTFLTANNQAHPGLIFNDPLQLSDFTQGTLRKLSLARKDLENHQESHGLFQLFANPDYETKIIQILETFTHPFQTMEKIIFLGTGGSSLGGKCLSAFGAAGKGRLHFMENIDPHSFEDLFRDLPFEKTGVLAISKSGSTAETLMQLLLCLQEWKKKGLDLTKHFRIITEPLANPLRELAQSMNIPCLDHPITIGGRFSAPTVVGLVAGSLASISLQDFLQGIRKTLTDPQLWERALLGAAQQYEALEKGACQSVILPYADRLESFAMWFRQLWGESLGKKGRGTTPIASFGTVDQHSQFQLYLDGPKDKFFTVITTAYNDPFFKIAPQSGPLDIYGERTMGQLMEAEQRAAIETLINAGCTVRHIHIPILDVHALGQLMGHFICETLCMASFLEVNPFDQPAVEEGKVLTRKYLSVL